MKYNMRNIFLEKSYTKYVEETSLRPFSKKNQNFPVGLSKYIETKVLTMCFYVMQRFF